MGGIRLGQVRTMSTAVECPTPPAFQQADPSWVCFEETYNSPPVGAREFGCVQRRSRSCASLAVVTWRRCVFVFVRVCVLCV